MSGGEASNEEQLTHGADGSVERAVVDDGIDLIIVEKG